MVDTDHNTLWEACACLEEWTETDWAQKRAFSIYKRTMDVLPKFKALLDAPATQSDAEPVAWRYRWFKEPWRYTEENNSQSKGSYTIEPLYTAPPRPDASARLIEVRDMFRQKAHDCDIEFKETYDPAAASAAYAYTEAAGEVERLRDRIKE